MFLVHKIKIFFHFVKIFRAFEALVKFWKFVFSSLPRHPFSLAPLSLSFLCCLRAFYSLLPPFPFSVYFIPGTIIASGYFPILRNFSITIKAVRIAKRICMAFQMKVKWKEFLPDPSWWRVKTVEKTCMFLI